MASNAENVFIWWRHHVNGMHLLYRWTRTVFYMFAYRSAFCFYMRQHETCPLNLAAICRHARHEITPLPFTFFTRADCVHGNTSVCHPPQRLSWLAHDQQWSQDCGLHHAGTGTRDIINTLMPTQNGRLFPDDIFNCIFLDENVWISLEIPLKLFLGVKFTIFQH